MPAPKRKAPAKSPVPPEPTLEAIAETVDTLPESTSPNAVICMRNVQSDGSIQVDVQALGDVKVTELDTILRLGLKYVAAQLGV